MQLIGFFDTISLQDPALSEWGLVGGMFTTTEYGVAVTIIVIIINNNQTG